MINLEIESKRKSVTVAMNLASNYFNSLGSINETTEQVKVGEQVVNKWIIAGKPIQNNFEIVDKIKGFGVHASTIFQKTPKGYLRISTNVITKEGKRAVGTFIPFDSPVAQAIEKGERYIGRAWVVDSWYITAYEPIRVNGVIKGILFVGEPEINYTALSEDFKTKKYFGSGYPYIVDEEGVLTAHPQSVGLSIAEYDFFKEMKEKKNGFVVYDWKGREKTQYFRYLEPIKSFITVGWYTEDYEAIFSELRTTIFIAVLFALAVVIGIIFIIVRSVMKQLGADPKEVQEIANKVAEGDFSMNINLKQGDTNSLLASMNKMVHTIKTMVQDVQKLGNSATEGKLDVRADATKFQGEYKQLVQGLNSTLDAIIGPLNVAAEYIDRISKGDVPPKIVDEYKGDFNEIKNNINQCIDAINLLIKDTYDLAEHATNGRLNERAKAERHQGDFRRLVQGINSTLDRLVGLIDNMPIPVRIVDKNNNVLYENQNKL
ncbi:MAG TPA: Cache 3/Cache 2 fusion domain-containing protein, partial [Candidatus Kapabacteria bacterium]|nr:Cache 3/Cache 2 fusion domain-containing protein [Candidatus Kapabacteria bacterium]